MERRRKRTTRTKAFPVVLAVAVVALFAIAGIVTYAYLEQMPGGTLGYPSYSGMMSTPTSTIDNVTFNSINAPPAGVAVDTVKNTISINTTGVTIPIEAAPLWYPRSGDYWLVYGLVNPTIIVKRGTDVHFLFINMDNSTHNLAITTIPPPYPYMPMLGSGMMWGWLAIAPMSPGVSNAESVVYYDTIVTTMFNNTGTFWYLCLYPGHAQIGMYGEIRVVN